jgi:CspA family cold shock protein
MPQGTVKFFNETKGFGFIVDDETQKDVFVHISGIQEEIRQNDRVSFKVAEDKKGSKAIDVRPL